ncbi:MAG: hypothetical protein H5T85_05745, partial [Actinobacteria bacterium]|nr:hypothetical protein [Actinomycetota bacterium]
IRESNIKRGNCVSIVWDKRGFIFYGLVIGEEAHIFLFDSNSTIEDVGKIEADNVKNGVLVFDDINNLISIVTDGSDITRIFIHNVDTERKMYSHMWGHFAFAPIEDKKITLKEEIVFTAGKNNFDGLIYILTNKGNVYSYSLDENKLLLISNVDNHNLSKVLCFDPESGDVYGVTKDGIFWRLSNKQVYYLDAQIPCMKNRNYVARASKLIWFKNKIFGCTLQDAYLFEYDIEDGKVRNLGRPDENFEIRDIDILEDGRIFGITASKDRGMGRIFCYSQERGFEDLGIIQGWQPVHDFAYEPLCIKAGSGGDFLIGNGENRDTVFLYCSSPKWA